MSMLFGDDEKDYINYLLNCQSTEIDLLKKKIGEILDDVELIRDKISYYDDSGLYDEFAEFFNKYQQYRSN